MNRLLLHSVLLSAVLFVAGGAASNFASEEDPAKSVESQIRITLDAQVTAWNNGDIAGFMDKTANMTGTLSISAEITPTSTFAAVGPRPS